MNTVRNEKYKVLERRSSTLHSTLYTIHSPKAFTLVELLTVIVIISMLAAISLVALNGAYTEAKIAKTRGTIAKLDAAIQQIFEEYEDRFGMINPDTSQISAAATALGWSGPLTSTQQAFVTESLKLHFIRDTMRMEMPDQWADVFDSTDTAVSPTAKAPIGSSSGSPGRLAFAGNSSIVADLSPVFSYYYSAYERYVNAGGDALGPNPAALLYLIIANLNPEALENFHGSEIADPDGDGFLKFVDAWGKPIQFIRWAPGFMGSDKQPDVLTKTDVTDFAAVLTTQWNDGPNAVTSAEWQDTTTISDPVRKRLVEEFQNALGRAWDPFDMEQIQRGWFLYPLIYSAGPDGISNYRTSTGIVTSPSIVPTSAANNLARGGLDPFANPWGMPDPNGTNGGHLDNIHNHRHAGGF